MPIAKILETEQGLALVIEGAHDLDQHVDELVRMLVFVNPGPGTKEELTAAGLDGVVGAQEALLRQLGEAFNRVFGDREILAKGELANSLTDLTELALDPRRGAHKTVGVTVRASFAGRFIDADVAHLAKASLLAWLRSRGYANPFAEDFVGFLLGHGALTDKDGSPMINLGIPMGVAIATLVEIAGFGPLLEKPLEAKDAARDCLARLGVKVEAAPGTGSMIGPGNGAEKPS